ncbi:hypothetical protein BXY70_1912 [Roseovarius halotolerans]|uniref:Uncharacterized protein n=1 Tax=Roseovarius halotolerans TaxID=505353 RepID=A0A1X6YZD0_9RHOB|nr:hypothetical protein BXY70_1912 [Roseovarius halotolerans]SLN35568.1 hypothetical protein ROH8110_01794 [Roseovarius halotolerans]
MCMPLTEKGADVRIRPRLACRPGCGKAAGWPDHSIFKVGRSSAKKAFSVFRTSVKASEPA